MAAADLCDLGIAELGRRYRGRELSPVDVTTAHLARIERLDKTLNSYVTVTADRALADARAAEEALRRGATTARSWASRSRTRTSTSRAESGPPGAPRCSRTGCPTRTRPCVQRLERGRHGDDGEAHHP